MPPLPATIDQDTISLIDALSRREKDLSSFQIPRLRDCKGPISAQQSFAAELREDLNVFAQQIEALELSADGQTKKSDRERVKVLTEEFRGSWTKMKKDMRLALLESKRNIDAQGRSNLEELLRPSTIAADKTLGGKSADDALMATNNDITETLRRTIGIMQGELERSVLTTQILETSTTTLRSTSIQHDTLDSLMQTSKSLITALEKADWMDRLLILGAMSFFALVVLFILKQRIVDRSLRIAFWWTRFLPSSGAKNVLPVASKSMEYLSSTASSTTESVLLAASRTLSSATESVVSATSLALSTGTASPEPSQPPLAFSGTPAEVLQPLDASSTIAEVSESSKTISSTMHIEL